MAKRRGMTTRRGVSFPGIRSVLGRRRTHAKLDRSLDHGVGLSLPVDVPPPLAPVLELHQLGIQCLELLLLLPLPQGPFRRPVDAAVGVIAIEVEQLAGQRLPIAGRQPLRAVRPQRQDQRPPLRGLGVEEDGVHELLPLDKSRTGSRRETFQFGGEDLGVGSKRAEPVDDEAPQPGVGTVAQQGHDLTRLPHAKESDRRPSLTFRQSVPGLFRDHRAVPDRGGDRRSTWGSPGDREGDHAISLRGQFPAPLEVSSGIETKKGTRLEPVIARPDGGVGAVQMPWLHDVGKRREFSQGVEVGVLLHVPVIDVAVLVSPCGAG